MGPLGEFVPCNLQTQLVVCRVGGIGEVVQQIQRLQDGGHDADADRVIALLDACHGGTRGGGTLRHQRHGKPPPQPRVAHVRSQLSQGAPSCRWRLMGGGHSNLPVS